MIYAQSLTRQFGKLTAVDDVSFHIARHEIVGLLGHNGAGKTTIMKMLSGYLEPSRGQIRIAGIDMADNARAVQRQLGYLPENLPVYPDMIAADYLDYVATLKGIPASERGAAVRAAVADTELGECALKPIKSLSRGYKQRMGVAQALLGQPQLLILDEPTNGLDPQQTLKMRALIRQLATSATIILSTHIMQEVDALCDRALLLHDGRLVLDERLDDLRASRLLKLRTSADEAALEDYLRHLPQIAALQCGAASEEFVEYTMTLHESAELDTAANNIAQCVVKAGAKLYLLHPLTRDLETIFTEATSAPEQHNGN